MSDNILFVVGPTATGKSLLALEVALKTSASIVNCDSIQVYRDLVIGSAQPSKEDFKIAPHYLYGYLSAGDSLTAADYCRDVEELINNKLSDKAKIFCGGSGFYIQALEKGMYQVPTLSVAQKKEVEMYIEENGWEKVYQELVHKDPALKEKVHANDYYRIRRAWEMIVATGGGRPSELAKSTDGGLFKNKKILKVGIDLDKNLLKKRIEERTHKMLSSGWIEEVEALLPEHKDWAALKSVGYLEVVEFLSGKLNRAEMIEKISISNMQLIKKQRTWFKRDPLIHWYSSENLAEAVKKACLFLEPI